MPHSRSTHRKRRPAADSDSSASADQPRFLPPLEPQRKLFYVSMILVAGVMAAMLALYFKAPAHPHPPSLSAPTSPLAPTQTVPR
jgi:hypothetical protein